MIKTSLKLFAITALVTLATSVLPAKADSPKEMEAEARAALANLYSTSPSAKALGEKAKAVLVFPGITKGGFIVGGQYGEGTLLQNDRAIGYYNTAAASFGLQAGIQKFGYALFFMNTSDLTYLDKSAGWELGVGPSITIVDEGIAGSLSTTTAREGVYAFFFHQKGLMAGMGLQGTKITKMNPKAQYFILTWSVFMTDHVL